MIEQDDALTHASGGEHGTAQGGWRRAAVGLAFGAVLGLVARIVLGPGRADPDGRPRG